MKLKLLVIALLPLLASCGGENLKVDNCFFRQGHYEVVYEEKVYCLNICAIDEETYNKDKYNNTLVDKSINRLNKFYSVHLYTVENGVVKEFNFWKIQDVDVYGSYSIYKDENENYLYPEFSNRKDRIIGVSYNEITYTKPIMIFTYKSEL